MSGSLFAWVRARPAFAWLWAAGFVSTVGDAFRAITVSLWLFEASGGSGPVMALATAVGVLSTLLLGTLAGVWADRWERRRTLLACDLLRLLCSLGLVGAAALHSVPLGLLALAFLSGVSVLGEVASETTLPRVVEGADLERANGLWVVMAQLSFIVAPLGAALVYSAYGAAYAFGVDALSFGLSALLLLRLPPLPTQEATLRQPERGRIWQELMAGLRLIGQDRLISSSLLALSLRVLSGGINSVVVLFFIAQTLGQSATDLVWLSTANGVAQVLTGSLVVAAAHRAALPVTLLGGLGVMVLGATAIALAPGPQGFGC
ncbi:MFS transporter [Deinococcus sp. Marseille-Q6407]|uniref:MFS transporter n=1 Tax=Deinococcus sp. Marseille-Q6407 TaxID=2969223 RepID=UPI0021C1CB4C|nr:MFS transporter [Deinococcus sp. Marseille-Q6407]